MDIAGLPVPADMQGVSLAPCSRGRRPPAGEPATTTATTTTRATIITRAHYGLRTMTHKLIYFWKKNQWEMYDLASDPDELHNLYNDPSQQQTVTQLKAELYRSRRRSKTTTNTPTSNLLRGPIDERIQMFRGPRPSRSPPSASRRRHQNQSAGRRLEAIETIALPFANWIDQLCRLCASAIGPKAILASGTNNTAPKANGRINSLDGRGRIHSSANNIATSSIHTVRQPAIADGAKSFRLRQMRKPMKATSNLMAIKLARRPEQTGQTGRACPGSNRCVIRQKR